MTTLPRETSVRVFSLGVATERLAEHVKEIADGNISEFNLNGVAFWAASVAFWTERIRKHGPGDKPRHESLVWKELRRQGALIDEA